MSITQIHMDPDSLRVFVKDDHGLSFRDEKLRELLTKVAHIDQEPPLSDEVLRELMKEARYMVSDELQPHLPRPPFGSETVEEFQERRERKGF